MPSEFPNDGSAKEKAARLNTLPPSQQSNTEKLSQIGDADLLKAFPGLAKPHKWIELVKESGLAERLLEQVILAEEMRQSRLPEESLEAWRRRRWNTAVEQAFIAQRHRFERASYYHLSVPEQGLAMELYYQLCNSEVSFDQLLAQYYPLKPGKPQKGILRDKPLHKLPKALAKRLRRSLPGIPLEPVVIGMRVAVLQLIERHPPHLDDATRSLLEQEVELEHVRRELGRRLEAASTN
jgi:hypothetical protein